MLLSKTDNCDFCEKRSKTISDFEKKGPWLGSDKKVTYSEDLDSETQNHREALKSVASASQE